MRASRLLDDAGRARVEAAITAAEARTAGEVVVCIATRSGRYDRGEDLFGVTVGLAAMIGLWCWRQGVDTGGWTPELALGLWPLVAVFLVGLAAGIAVATAIPLLGTLLSRRRELIDEVEDAAQVAFLRLGVRRTTAATGVLVYVSLLERTVRVVADEAIATRAGDAAWNGVRDAVLDGLRRGAAADGLCRGVERAGEVLAELAPRSDEDRDELADRVWIID